MVIKYKTPEGFQTLKGVKVKQDDKGLVKVPESVLHISGNAHNWCADGKLAFIIEQLGDQITTENLDSCGNMFAYTNITEIPFDLNPAERFVYHEGQEFINSISVQQMFMYAQIRTVKYFSQPVWLRDWWWMYGHSNIEEIPDDFTDNYKFWYDENDDWQSCDHLFYDCKNLKTVSPKFMEEYGVGSPYKVDSYRQYSANSPLDSLFQDCKSLEEVTNIPPINGKWVSGYGVMAFNQFLSGCENVKRVAFKTNNGEALPAYYAGQILDLSNNFGRGYMDYDIWDYTWDRYNHASAVETINTINDCSAFISSIGQSANTIIFKGVCGIYTPEGAVNTLTEDEIAVATSKGWTVAIN